VTSELDDPIARFHEELARARELDASLATEVPMSLATVGADGAPSVRIVLLKDADARGFVFYTNRESRKARDLDATGRAALVFHFASTRVQVRVEGLAERTTDEESDAYFATRHRGSQLGAWASSQSRVLSSREALEESVAHYERLYDGKPVPRPPHWGGYRVVPARVELWYGRENRLHDRFLFVREGGAWRSVRLFP